MSVTEDDDTDGIGILVGVRKLEITEQAMARMAGLGYQHRGEMGIPGRRYFRKGDRYPRDFNVHVVLWGRDRSGMTMWPSATTCAPTRSGRSSTPNSNANY